MKFRILVSSLFLIMGLNHAWSQVTTSAKLEDLSLIHVSYQFHSHILTLKLMAREVNEFQQTTMPFYTVPVEIWPGKPVILDDFEHDRFEISGFYDDKNGSYDIAVKVENKIFKFTKSIKSNNNGQK